MSEGLHTALLIVVSGALVCAVAWLLTSGPQRLVDWLNRRADITDLAPINQMAMAEDEPPPISPRQTRRRIETLERAMEQLSADVHSRDKHYDHATRLDALEIEARSAKEEFNRHCWLNEIETDVDAANWFFALTRPKESTEAGGWPEVDTLGPLERAIRLEELIKYIEKRCWDVLTSGELGRSRE